MDNIEIFIESNWEACVRENRKDKGTLLGVPYPYTVPSTEAFDEIYYWDTYFTNLGLLKSGHQMLAKQNTDNMLYLVNKFGFMPNGTRTWYLTRSQPPFLSEMVKDVYNYYKDNVWLEGAYSALKKEYKFWDEKRISDMGLNCYCPEVDMKEADDMVKGFKERIGFDVKSEKKELARHVLATCESGWDMNPRWGFEAQNYAAVDLNSLLFGMENNMAYFAEILGYDEETAYWKLCAGRRLNLMNKVMLNEDKLFLDYNLKTGELSSIFSAASYFPLFTKAASEEQAEAAVKNLTRIEEKYGIATCEKGSRDISYQWDYPNGWACMQYILIAGLSNYGYTNDAKRIAEKYIGLAEMVFEETGNLWEKYNVADGSINVNNEYKMPTMMGWSAGVYIAAKVFINGGKINEPGI